jgi:hypothetical protein
MREKDKAGKISKEPQRVICGSNHLNESQIFDSVLDDDFDNNPTRHPLMDESNNLDESAETSSSEDVDESMGEDSDGSSQIEGRCKVCHPPTNDVIRFSLGMLNFIPHDSSPRQC